MYVSRGLKSRLFGALRRYGVLGLLCLSLVWILPARAAVADVEADYRDSARQWDLFQTGLSRADRLALQTQRGRLSPRTSYQRRLYSERERLRGDVNRLQAALKLKKGFLHLNSFPDAKTILEADHLAAETVRFIEELKERYRMVRPALLHNILANLGLKKEGYCWHWTRDLQDRLSQLSLQKFELRWGVARQGGLREHNALVVTPAGGRFGEGIVIDGWRLSGAPFWILLKEDKYPWTEDDDPL